MDAAVDVWFCDLAAAPSAAAVEMLSSAERQRAARFVHPVDRARFVAAHATMRSILGDCLHCEPRAIVFDYGPQGRPRIAGSALDCNLAHSEDRAVLAIGTGVRVGIDLERERANGDIPALVRRFFAPEERAAYAAVAPAERQRWFFRQWVAKEAVLKAHGGGLSVPTDGFAVRFQAPDAGSVHASGPDPGDQWHVRMLTAGHGWHAAVAVDAPLAHVRITIRALPPVP